MWVKVDVGNHYGVFEFIGVEMYREEEGSYILYGYLPRPVPHVPVGIDRDLRDGITHFDFVKIHEFHSEDAAKAELEKMQDFMNKGATGVYVVSTEGEMPPRFGTYG